MMMRAKERDSKVAGEGRRQRVRHRASEKLRQRQERPKVNRERVSADCGPNGKELRAQSITVNSDATA